MSLLDTFFGRRKRPIWEERNEAVYKIPKEPKEQKVQAVQEEKIEVSMRNEREQLKEEIEKLSKQSDALLAAVEENRNVIAQNVHQENVKAFRNIQAILEELDKKMAKSDRQDKQMDSLKTYIKCTTWFSIINLMVLVIYILYTMGVF